MQRIRKLGQVIDRSTDWIGKLVAYVIPIIMCLAVCEVVLRYIFNSPTVWIWQMNQQLLLLLTCLAAASAFQHGYFISLDLFIERTPKWAKPISDIWAFLLVLVLAVVVLWQGIEFFWTSFAIREISSSGVWHPPLYPIKFFIPLAGFLLILQAVANLIRR